jgi:D-alanine--poly(phosphoribitol) ligase subunit 1
VRLTADSFSEACHTSVAIGEAIPGMDVRLLDGPNEDEGEIVISGPQLANGYLGDTATTAKAFRRADIDGMPTRAYYTGDWAKRIGRHTFFVSRRDFQVKILGYRVELDEVTAALRKCGYTTAAAILHKGELHAFVESPQDVDTEKTRGQLSGLLEPHAVPQVFHALPHLPRNENDKIDVLALAKILDSRGQS